ncbi:hypothetical protein GH714_000780 [Hevea brasiliensis]|uniref:Uncharacterized protein n=1 Tax=Hevea brasiliensis TaxID=3981 RepID=A0A6A6M8G9_HEVBR|nr:hypothetical protein GH714_000780 [Hevea brasiliensis]
MASLSFTHIRTSGTTSFALVNTRPTSLTTHRHRNRVGFLRVVADAGAKQPLGQREPDLTVTVNGLHLPNPFVIGSGPPGTTTHKSYKCDSQICPTRAGANGSGQIIGWENIELISDRPLETMLKEFKQLKEEYPDRIHIASVMEEYDKAAWEELIDRVEVVCSGIMMHGYDLIKKLCDEVKDFLKMHNFRGVSGSILQLTWIWYNGSNKRFN